MASIIKPKRTSTASKVPTTTDLTDGELGVNTTDGKTYVRNGVSVFLVGEKNGTPYTDIDARAAVLSTAITDGDTTHAPDSNTVFDGLADKMPLKLTVTGININYTYLSDDANKAIGKTTGTPRNYTVDASALIVGAYYYAVNYSSAGNISVLEAAGTTLRLTGTATTGTRTVAPFGMAKIWIRSATEAWVDGPAVT